VVNYNYVREIYDKHPPLCLSRSAKWLYYKSHW